MKLWACILKDIKLSIKSNYTWVLLIFIAVFTLVSLFLVPEDMNTEPEIHAFVDASGPVAEYILKELIEEGNTPVGSRDEILQRLNENRSSVGLYVTTENNRILFEFILQGYESERLKASLEATMAGWGAIEADYPVNSTVTVLESSSPVIPVNKGMLPIFLVMESSLMGLFMVAAYVFQDKEEGTIRAYAVTPAALWKYLMSKVVVFVLFGWVSGLLATVFIMGLKLQYLQFILLLTSASIFGTVLGLLASGLFDSFTKSMTAIFALMFVLGSTVVSYYMPSFAPLYIRLLPTYPMLFAFREVLFPTGNMALVYMNVLGYLAASAVLFGISVKLHQKRLA